jgi:hypothetical protein
MISQKDLKFCNSPPENLTVYEFLTFTYGPLNFCKKIATRNFQKKRPQTSVDPRFFLKKASTSRKLTNHPKIIKQQLKRQRTEAEANSYQDDEEAKN